MELRWTICRACALQRHSKSCPILIASRGTLSTPRGRSLPWRRGARRDAQWKTIRLLYHRKNKGRIAERKEGQSGERRRAVENAPLVHSGALCAGPVLGLLANESPMHNSRIRGSWITGRQVGEDSGRFSGVAFLGCLLDRGYRGRTWQYFSGEISVSFEMRRLLHSDSWQHVRRNTRCCGHARARKDQEPRTPGRRRQKSGNNHKSGHSDLTLIFRTLIF